MGANIGLLLDMDLVKKYGADHIGLYRTEFPFLVRKTFPSEEEQYELYKKIIKKAQSKSITIRIIDVGGDKFLSYLDYPKEQNPFLGWRSIRVCLELENIFRTQIRAILRASVLGQLRILLPMITTVNEIRKSVTLINEEKADLAKKGIPFDAKVEIGIMVEVPAAIKILDRLLQYADFVSIGTNDLVQYILAVDRNNEKLSALYNPLHPTVISSILEIVSTCKQNKKELSICGEAASNIHCVALFLAMEVNRLSMDSDAIPIVKNFIRTTRLKDMKTILKKVIQMEDTEEISSYLDSVTYTHLRP
jgi:phosphoenolpyruvate-protein phosphotransferase